MRFTLVYLDVTGEIATCLERLLAPCSARADFSVLQTMEWEDFVSVRLHQLDFNETARVSAGARRPVSRY